MDTLSSKGIFSMIRDRDYIFDSLGNFLRVVGDRHNDCVVSYVKYFPSEYGVKVINGKPYAFNSFVPRSLALLSEVPGRIQFSEQVGTMISVTPRNQIKHLFSCRNKIVEILSNREVYIAHSVGRYLIELLDVISQGIDINNIGITGSFLIDCYDDNSDIDLVCYGANTYNAVKNFFQNSDVIKPYKGSDALPLYKRRMQHMLSLDFETLITQEGRKLQGFIGTKRIHVNCQPLREDGSSSIFSHFNFMEVGDITCILEIDDNLQGFFSPACYRIKIIDVLDSLYVGILNLKKRVEFLICLTGTYAGAFLKGDKVFVQGKLTQLTSMVEGQIIYGIELSSLNNTRMFSAALLS
jgi:hypothetical protein